MNNQSLGGSDSRICIAIDAMGGDNGVKVTVPATLNVALNHPHVRFCLVGLKNQLPKLQDLPENVSLIAATEVVEMDEPARTALRQKKNSSMRVALNQVNAGHAAACVSAGNTGALMALSHHLLKMLPEISRPAIVTQLPTLSGYVRMLDLGANVSASSQQLYEFALMGAAIACASGIQCPKVALLNVGHELIKGRAEVKSANDRLMMSQGFDYLGYVEGSEIFSGRADVIVCDGFVGNVVLKSCEGMLGMLKSIVVEVYQGSWLKSFMMWMMKRVFQNALSRFHPDQHNGAVLAGLNGLVIKSHGAANITAFEHAILTALTLVHEEASSTVNQHIDRLFSLNDEELSCSQD
tara:strand:- start:97 stop:1152 length:1056 start_codon:yes stop_codon:yes gene_type:complete